MSIESDMVVLPEIRRDQHGFSRRRDGPVKLWRCLSCGWYCSVCRQKKKCCLVTDPRQGGESLHPSSA